MDNGVNPKFRLRKRSKGRKQAIIELFQIFKRGSKIRARVTGKTGRVFRRGCREEKK